MTAWKKLAAVAAFAAVSGTAHAFGSCDTPTSDTTKWKSPAAISAQLKAEGQKSLGFATTVNQFDKSSTGAAKTHALLFVATKDRRVGHIIESNEAPGTPATLMCDAQPMVNVKAYDASVAGVPAELNISSTKAQALKECETLVSSSKVSQRECGFINDELLVLEKNGLRTIIRGQGAKNVGGGDYLPLNYLVSVIGNISGRYNGSALNVGGLIKNTLLPSGATLDVGDLIYPTFDNLAISETGVAVASLKP